MKYLYQCGKCGKTYEDMDEAWSCENSHIGVKLWGDYDAQLSNNFVHWKTGDIMPRTLAFESDALADENGVKSYFAIYEFKRYLTDAEIKKVKDEYREVHPEEQE